MGILADSLSAPSSYRAKKTAAEGGRDLWAELKDRIDGAILIADLDDFVRWLDDYPLEYPEAYRAPLDEMIEAKREELEAESIPSILKDKWDF